MRPPALLLHGVYAGAGPHEWDALVPFLGGRFDVECPDLLSPGPWDAERLTGEVRAAIERHDTPVVVASSLTGAHALRAVAAGATVRALVLITPTGLGRAQRQASGTAGRIVSEVLRRTPARGVVTGVLGSRASVALFLKRAVYGDPALVTDEVVDTYAAAADRPGAQDAAVAFVAGRLAVPVDAAAVGRVKPLVSWGPAQRFVGDEEPMRWRNAGADVREIQGTGLPHAERPEVVAELVASAAG